MKRIVLLFVLFISVVNCSFAHSGRTDSNGGHYDRSTGEYHYHHGYSAHQHPNGVCPYESNNSEVVDVTEKVLKVNNDDSRYINGLNEKIKDLESQIYAKENTIESLNKRLADKNKEIEEIKSSQESLNFILWAVIIGLVIYFFVKRRKNVKEY